MGDPRTRREERPARRRSARGPRPLRLFAALYPPPELARALAAAVAALELPPHRVPPAPQIHLTLHFLGDVPGGELPGVEETVRAACRGAAAFELTPRAWRLLPARGPARLLAVETDAPAPLRELQRRLAARLSRAPRARPGDRFLPHLTVARFRTPARERPPLPDASLPDGFAVDRVRLMRSRLQPDGAVHETLLEVGLSRG